MATLLVSDARPPSPRRSVSVVCVYNNVEVRQRCLDRSIEDHRFELPDIELVAVDNTTRAFASAGAALNHGASIARHDYVAFVHQDVYLHSLDALGRAAQALADDPEIGVIGPVGISADGSIIGRIRDRVTLIGKSALIPSEVDSLDEVLFMASREILLQEPLSETIELAWHAYAVEYGLRMKAAGRKIRAMDIPLTHNSLAINRDKLDLAHAAVARLYPDALPVRTTCGTIRSGGCKKRGPTIVLAQRWRYRWLKESCKARSIRQLVPGVPVVLSDIRLHVDEVIAAADGVMHVINIDPDGLFRENLERPLRLQRMNRELTVIATSIDGLATLTETTNDEDSILVTNIEPVELARIRRNIADSRCLLGLYNYSEIWLLVGPAVHGVSKSRFPLATILGGLAFHNRVRQLQY